MADEIINKVANSGLVSLDLEKYIPAGEIVRFDLKDHLFMGMILKEKDFREALKNLDWSVYQDKFVAITCSADAIIPLWAYMLVSSSLQPVAKDIYVGDEKEMYKFIFLKNLSAINPSEFEGQRIVVKGCGDKEVESYAYAEITKILRPVTRSIMYGEPCSTVPVYKSKA
jgi:hypothetical protein